MKWLKTAANLVSNLNAKTKKRSAILCNQVGMSLAELVVVLGVSSIVIVGAGSVMVFVADSFSKIIDKDEAESNLTRAAYALRTIAVQAVGLYVVAPSATGEGIGAAGAGASGAHYAGQIVQTLDTAASFNNYAGVPANKGRIVEVAQFHRETSSANAAANSIFQPTAIFFKTPWDTCPPNGNNIAGDGLTYAGERDTCSGQLAIAWNQAGVGQPITGVIGAAGVDNHQRFLSPGGDMQMQIYDRFISLVVTTTSVDGAVGSYARDSRFRLTVRYFMGLSPITWNYDPNDNGHMAKELSMEVYIGFRNNYQGRSQLTADEPERLHGSPYYFPFVSSIPVWL